MSAAGDRGEDRPRLRGPWWYPDRRRLTAEQREHLLSQIFFEGAERAPFLRRFAALLTFSVLIAAFGLAQDSAPVVIGAMLISPLTTPLLGVAVGLVSGQLRRQLESLAILIVATAGGIGVAAGVMWLMPEAQALTLESEQLLARTDPGLLDLAVAVVAGAAGAYVLIRRDAIGALPGVAIAVALVPPLATVGMTLELGRWDLAREALLLYGTNLAGIVLASCAVLLVLGAVSQRQEGGGSRPARAGIVLLVAAAALLVVPLAAHTRERVLDAQATDDARRVADEWVAGRDLRVDRVAVHDRDGRIEVDISGPAPPSSLEPLAQRLADELSDGLTVEVDWMPRRRTVLAAGRGGVASESGASGR